MPSPVYPCNRTYITDSHRLRMINVRKTSGSKRTGNIRSNQKITNWELHDLYSSFYIAEVIKPPPQKKNWAKYVARIGRKEMHIEFD